MWYLSLLSQHTFVKFGLDGTVTYASYHMEHTRSTDRYAYSRFSSQVAVGRGSVDRGLFIAETDKSYAKIHCLLRNVDDREAREAK